jgi:hypothetical protein
MLRETGVSDAHTDLGLLGHPEDLIQLLTAAGERVTDPS